MNFLIIFITTSTCLNSLVQACPTTPTPVSITSKWCNKAILKRNGYEVDHMTEPELHDAITICDDVLTYWDELSCRNQPALIDDRVRSIPEITQTLKDLKIRMIKQLHKEACNEKKGSGVSCLPCNNNEPSCYQYFVSMFDSTYTSKKNYQLRLTNKSYISVKSLAKWRRLEEFGEYNTYPDGVSGILNYIIDDEFPVRAFNNIQESSYIHN
eukprot:Pgem_evm1s14018